MRSKTLAYLIAVCSLVTMTNIICFSKTEASSTDNYKRIVIVSDAHYPSKTNRLINPASREKKIKQKLTAVHDINSWQDVNLVVFPGDTVQQTGSELDYQEAKTFVDKFNKPVLLIPGNHEYMYKDTHKQGKLVRGSMQERTAKLQLFLDTFHMKNEYYTKRMAGYRLIFLSPEPASGKYLTELSAKELGWLDKTLTKYPTEPTIIFFHAPLDGTLAKYSASVNSSNFIAQPKQKLETILLRHPQIKLWVSGHTHTPPTNPSFAAPINYYHGILDVHNPTWDGKQVWTNSLYLYPDKIIIKTYDHKKHKFMPQFTRTITVDSAESQKAA